MTPESLDVGAAAGHEFRRHWRALLGAMIAASVGVIGLNAYTGGAFVPELVAKVGYTREQLSLATFMLSATVALVAPFVGQAIDRWGATRIIGFAVVGEALGFLGMGAAPAHFGWFATAMVVLALLGVGTAPPTYARVVAARFNRRRGLALGLMISGLGVTAIAAPMVMTRVIAAVGWRGGYWTLAAFALVMGALGLWLIRQDPAPVSAAAAEDHADHGDWSALSRPLYWFILACFAAPALFGGGYLLHLITILRQRGFAPDQAAQVQSLVGVSIIAGRCLSGAALDRFRASFVAAAVFAISAAGTAMLLSSSGSILCLAALAVGLTIGAELDILAFTVSRYFGLASFGRLYSLAYSVMILAGGASPLLIARLARSGDYTTAIVVSSVGVFLSAVAIALLPRSERRSAVEIGAASVAEATL
ncbi:MFS transporter [Phenylobacterium sp.]|jgi:MFS family permease|uniref:MFS transporter n=1 Tax=Phenylobacterium sp. TaxID=1871053 RepID=UPI002E2F8A87|nr:MFS transporter [Phenylobacterium sp.]HEX3364192.1 MFS transporter [Phenylobacterium sp.]